MEITELHGGKDQRGKGRSTTWADAESSESRLECRGGWWDRLKVVKEDAVRARSREGDTAGGRRMRCREEVLARRREDT